MKISQLDNELTSADNDDLLAIVDVSASETKKITKQNLVGGGGDSFPVGSLMMFGGSSAPTGWLICDGNAISRSTYSDLFAIIGEVFGVGDGSTTFNLPDLRGRSPLGVGSGDGLTARALGDKGGEEDHQDTESEMPFHDHQETARDDIDVFVFTGTGSAVDAISSTGSAASATPLATRETGGDGAHNTMHPFLAVNFIIKY